MPDLHTRLRSLLGTDAVERETAGPPRVSPDTAQGVALVCRLAREEGWKVRLEGYGTWLEPDAEADLVLSTRGLDRVISVSPSDLVASVEAGTPFDRLTRRLAEHRMWLAIDPPGRPERSIGSIAATATWGPIRAGFGPIRDHVLGTTIVAGDGRVLTSGGRVVKNVAGYDLTKLHIGSFGAFGIMTQFHLRLRTLPRADLTMTATGSRDALTFAGRTVMESGVDCAALELLSPSVAAQADWVLAARFLGTQPAVHAGAGLLQAETDLTWRTLEPTDSSALWGLARRAPLSGPVTVRLGVLIDGLDECLDLLERTVTGGEDLVTAGATGGGIRWSGSATADRLIALRREAAQREIPLTLERAPWPTRRAVGHFGAYREGVGGLVERLRAAFDPGQCLAVAIEGQEDA